MKKQTILNLDQNNIELEKYNEIIEKGESLDEKQKDRFFRNEFLQNF